MYTPATPEDEEKNYQTARKEVVDSLRSDGCACPEPVTLSVTSIPWSAVTWKGERQHPAQAASCSHCGRSVMIPPDVSDILRWRMRPPAW